MEANPVSTENADPHPVPVTMGSPRFRRVELGGLRATEAFFPPGTVLAPHHHEHTLVSVMLDGGFDVCFGPLRFESRPGTVITEPAGERHANQVGSAGARTFVLEADGAFERAHLGPCAGLLSRPVGFRAPEATLIARRASREIHAPDAATPLALEALALELLAAAARLFPVCAAPRRAPWLERARELLHAQALRALRVGDLAAEVGVHRVHLSRAFRLHFGCSIGTYQRNLRVEWAASQLAETDLPLSEIALRAGFADQSHFTRVFKRLLGRTPQHYRFERRPRGQSGGAG